MDRARKRSKSTTPEFRQLHRQDFNEVRPSRDTQLRKEVRHLRLERDVL